MRTLAAGLAVVAALATGGCGDSSSGTADAPTTPTSPTSPTSPSSATSPAGPTSPSAPSSPSTRPAPVVPLAQWIRLTDGPSHTSFALPQRTVPQSRPSQGGFAGRVYQARSGDTGVAVTLEVSDHDLRTFDVRAVLQALAGGLQQQGATQVRLRHVRPVRSQGMTGVDGIISFVSADKAKVSYWRVRAMHDRRRVVELQALAFLDPGTHGSPAVDRAFARLTSSFRA